MNKITNHIDVDKIVTLKVVHEKMAPWFQFVKSKQIKKFFGLISTKKYTEEGWVDLSSFYKLIYTIDELKERDYKIINNMVYKKPYLIIRLLTGDEFLKTFENENEINEYVEALKLTSGKTYEILIT